MQVEAEAMHGIFDFEIETRMSQHRVLLNNTSAVCSDDLMFMDSPLGNFSRDAHATDPSSEATGAENVSTSFFV